MAAQRGRDVRWAERAVRDRKHAKSNPFAQVKGDFEVLKLLGEPTLVKIAREC